MTKEKVLEVIRVYRKEFERRDIPKIEFPHDQFLDVDPSYQGNGAFFASVLSKFGLAHCHQMLDKMEQFVREDRMDKVFRWLGFIQGVLWRSGVYNLDSLKNHSRPDDSGPENK